MEKKEKTLKEKLQSLGVERLADILLQLADANRDVGKHIDIVVASLEDDPKEVIKLIKRSMSSIKRSTKFIRYHEASAFRDELSNICSHIMEGLSPRFPLEAYDLMLQFLSLGERVFDRVEDRSGMTLDVFREACTNFAKLCSAAELTQEEVAQLVYSHHMQNSYGVYYKIITKFKDTLGDIGFELLRNKLLSSQTDENLLDTVHGLMEIADCQEDVDAYIEAAESLRDRSEILELSIIQRLVKSKRPIEALERLSELSGTSYRSYHEIKSLKIEALELSGQKEKAQEERIDYFSTTLSTIVYKENLENTPDDLKPEFRAMASKQALDSSNCNSGLCFLIELGAHSEAAKLIYAKYENLEGYEFRGLKLAAKELSSAYPLAATLLYRKLIAPILDPPVWKYYPYAARYFVNCEALSDNIEEWRDFPNHETYAANIQSSHKRKVSFWNELEKARERLKKKSVLK